jgi:hypothetical protein
MHLTNNPTERGFLERRRMSALESPHDAASKPLPKVFDMKGGAIALKKRHGLVSKWNAVFDSGDQYWLVLIERTPKALEIFGRKRLFVFETESAADAQMSFLLGHPV